MTTIVKEQEQFIEQDCTIALQGKTFSSGGSWIIRNTKTGKLEGIMYDSVKTQEVTSWDGKLRIPARYGRVYQTNMPNCRRQYCWFTYEGKRFVGINYSVDWQSCIKVHEVNN